MLICYFAWKPNQFQMNPQLIRFTWIADCHKYTIRQYASIVIAHNIVSRPNVFGALNTLRRPNTIKFAETHLIRNYVELIQSESGLGDNTRSAHRFIFPVWWIHHATYNALRGHAYVFGQCCAIRYPLPRYGFTNSRLIPKIVLSICLGLWLACVIWLCP